MKTKRQAQGEARRLFRLCLVDGSLDEGRVRSVVQQVIDAERPGSLDLLTRYQRLVRLNRAAHGATVESVTPLPPDVRASIEADLARIYGRGIETSYTANPTLLGGVRITVGSDVYDGSIHGRLAALEEQF
jgi:F-type H+-transporting ATPase subunit delta